jgi:hypothetical protein
MENIVDGYQTLVGRNTSDQPRRYGRKDYEKLPPGCGAIRLLKLLPSRDKQTVPLCELVVVRDSDADHKKYDALSWCWGTQEKSAYIHIVTEHGTLISVMYIQPNLLSALIALRSSTKQRLLWIDAICINQDR